MKINNFIRTIEKVKEKSELDISIIEDISICLMNLVALEEHSFFSYIKTKDEKFLKLLEATREIRKNLLKLIVKDNDDSEKWCMSKHFLASSMRLFEVGNRLLHDNRTKEAKKMYDDSAELYALFWQLNWQGNKNQEIKIKSKEKKSIFSSIKELLKCCKE